MVKCEGRRALRKGAGMTKVPGLGSAQYSGPPITVATWGSYVLSYRVGEKGLGPESVIRFQLPDSWHAWRRNGAKGVQSHAPAADNYVTARVSHGRATIACEVEGSTDEDVVKSNRTGLDGREGRYVYVTRVTVVEGRLEPGDEIEVVFGDTSGGSRGFVSALHPEGPEPVAVGVDANGSGEEVTLDASDSPVLDVQPGDAYELLVTVPSLTVVGEESTLRLVVVDVEGNRVLQQVNTPVVAVRDGAADWGLSCRASSPVSSKWR